MTASREKNSPGRAATLPPKCYRVPKTMPLCRGGHAPSCCQVSRASELSKVCFVLVDRLCRWAPDFFQKKKKAPCLFFSRKTCCLVCIHPTCTAAKPHPDRQLLVSWTRSKLSRIIIIIIIIIINYIFNIWLPGPMGRVPFVTYF